MLALCLMVLITRYAFWHNRPKPTNKGRGYTLAWFSPFTQLMRKHYNNNMIEKLLFYSSISGFADCRIKLSDCNCDWAC